MNSQQFAEEITAMQDVLYRVSYGLLLNRADCADAVQEALLRAWEKRHTLREEGYFRTWVIRILINECYTLMRRRKRTLPLEALPEPIAPPDSGDPDLHDAIARLDAKLRLPVVLHYMEGYSVSEIADMLRVPGGTIKTRLSKARKLLKAQLTNDFYPINLTERRP